MLVVRGAPAQVSGVSAPVVRVGVTQAGCAAPATQKVAPGPPAG